MPPASRCQRSFGLSVTFEQSYMLVGPNRFAAPILAVQQSRIGDCDTCLMTFITVQVPSELSLGVPGNERSNPRNAVVITQDGSDANASRWGITLVPAETYMC